MAKITVSREHVIKYPSLKGQLGKTVDASVIQRAESDARVASKDAAKKAPKVEVTPAAASAKKVAAPRKRAAKKAAKKTASK